MSSPEEKRFGAISGKKIDKRQKQNTAHRNPGHIIAGGQEKKKEHSQGN